MDGGAFIDFASRLAASASAGPAGYRSSISRAYYGAFHLARSLLLQFGFHSVGGNEHQWVHRHFFHCKMAAAVEVGRMLMNLHESRKEADYDLDEPKVETSSHAVACVERADAIRDRVEICARSENVDQVRSEMVEYRKRVNL
jgi:uncharacterized protein (UPF0332 family)